jgi:hypothetical protein
MLNSQQLIYLISFGFLLGMQPAMTQSAANRPTPTNRSQPHQVIFQPPPNQGRPKYTSSAGSRRDRFTVNKEFGMMPSLPWRK